MPFVRPDWTLDLKPVPIARRHNPQRSKPPLKRIPIAQPKLLDIEPHRHRQRQSTLKQLAIPHRLRRDVLIVRRDRYVLSKPEREPHPDSLIHGTANITSKTERP